MGAAFGRWQMQLNSASRALAADHRTRRYGEGQDVDQCGPVGIRLSGINHEWAFGRWSSVRIRDGDSGQGTLSHRLSPNKDLHGTHPFRDEYFGLGVGTRTGAHGEMDATLPSRPRQPHRGGEGVAADDDGLGPGSPEPANAAM